MKIKTLCSAFIFVVLAVSVNSQSLNLPSFKNSSIADPGSYITGLTRSTKLVHTKSINYEWSGSSWVYLSNAKYSYNADGIQTLLTLVDTTRSLNLFKQINSYDVNKNSTGFIYQLWDSTGKKWDTVQGQRLLYQYNTSNFMTQKILQAWNKGWNNSSKEDYILDANGKYTMITVYNWAGNSWAPYYMDTLCTWQGDQLASFTEKIPISGNWINDVKYSSIFNGKDFVSFYCTYNGTGWDSLYRFTRIFDTYGGYSHVTQQFNAGTWVNAGRSLYYFDSLKNYCGWRNDEWSGSSWQQSGGTYIVHTYNTSELMLSEILSEYSTMNHKLEYKEKHIFTEFQIPSGVSIKELSSVANIKIYPNPASDCIFIESATNAKNGSIVNMYDINGRLILNRATNEKTVKVDLNGFKTGMYLMEVINETGVSRNRIMVK